MSKECAVYIGGFSNPAKSVERVGDCLAEHFKDVEVLTFPDAMKYPDTVAQSVENATVVTHSAGMLALYGSDILPAAVHAFGAPFPRSRLGLFFATAQKTCQMFLRADNRNDLRQARRFNAESLSTLLTPTKSKGIGHWKYLVNGAISNFDSIDTGRLLVDKGSDVTLVYGEHDLYYPPAKIDTGRTKGTGLAINIMPGLVHDSIVLDPGSTFDQYFSMRSSIDHLSDLKLFSR